MHKYNFEDSHPLAINILKLQRYNFDYFNCQEVIFFEFIVVKAKSFKNGNDIGFYQSSQVIENETGIKKHSLNSIIKKLSELGFIKVTIGGMPRVKHFKVNFEEIRSKSHLIYHYPNNDILSVNFKKLLDDYFQLSPENSQEKNNNKNTNKYTKKEYYESSESEEDCELKKKSVRLLIGDLQEIYIRQTRKYNGQHSGTDKHYTESRLVVTKKIRENLLELLEHREKVEILNSFTAYIDEVISRERKANKILPYFLKIKDGDYDVINLYLYKFHAMSYKDYEPESFEKRYNYNYR